jgi:hypothetical protein
MSKYSLRTLEKLAYLTGIPCVLGYAGYTLYFKSKTMEEERLEELRRMEEKYL